MRHAYIDRPAAIRCGPVAMSHILPAKMRFWIRSFNFSYLPCRDELLNSLLQHGIALIHSQMADSVRQRFLRSDQHQDLLRPGDAGIDQVPLQHDVVVHQHRDHNDRIL